MNLGITGVTEPPPSKTYDLRDRLAFALLGAGFIASWTYAFLHPSDAVYIACVGGTGAWGCAYHALNVHDDKTPDRN